MAADRGTATVWLLLSEAAMFSGLEFIHDSFPNTLNSDWFKMTFYSTAPAVAEWGSYSRQKRVQTAPKGISDGENHESTLSPCTGSWKCLPGRPWLWRSPYQAPCLTPELAELVTLRIKLPLVPVTDSGGCCPSKIAFASWMLLLFWLFSPFDS